MRLLCLLPRVERVTRSLPPPHAGCPRGDPGPLPVLTRCQALSPQARDSEVTVITAKWIRGNEFDLVSADRDL